MSVARIGGRTLPHRRPATRTPSTSRWSGSTSTAAGSWSTGPVPPRGRTHGPIHLVEVDGATHRISRDEGGVVRSAAPALVRGGLVGRRRGRRGGRVRRAGSMKMETVLRAPFRGRVPRCRREPGRDRRAADAPRDRRHRCGRRRRPTSSRSPAWPPSRRRRGRPGRARPAGPAQPAARLRRRPRRRARAVWLRARAGRAAAAGRPTAELRDDC